MRNTQQPVKATSKRHLQRLLKAAIETHGPQVDCNHIDVSGIKDMSSLFAVSAFNGDISQWNTSSVVNMSAMFLDSPFDGDLSRWDTSSVTDMRHMFAKSKRHSGQPSFTGNISKWTLRSLDKMDCMFSNCEGPLQGVECWDVSNVCSMASLFSGTTAALDLSKWDVSGVRDMSFMFAHSSGKTGLNAWDVSKATNMNGMFQRSTDAVDIAGWNVAQVLNFEFMFFGSSVGPDLSEWSLHSKALINGMLDVDTMLAMDTISILHWVHALEKDHADFLLKWPTALERFHLHTPMLNSLGLPTLAAATWLQEDWLGRHPVLLDSTPLPSMNV